MAKVSQMTLEPCRKHLRYSVIQVKAGIQGKIEMPMNKQPAVYILASKRNGTLYTGVTSDLVKKVWELELIESANPDWQDLDSTIV